MADLLLGLDVADQDEANILKLFGARRFVPTTNATTTGSTKIAW